MLVPQQFTFDNAWCQVRPLDSADFSAISGIYTDGRTQQFVGQHLSEAAALARLQACLQANAQRPLRQVYLTVLSQQQPAGVLAGFAMQPHLATIELGIMLLPGSQRPGLAKAAFGGLIQQVFALGFWQVQASMQPQNLAAQRLVRQCGMHRMTADQRELRYQISR